MGNTNRCCCEASFDERVLIADFDHVVNEEGRDMDVKAVRVEIPESFLKVAGKLSESLRETGADFAMFRHGFNTFPLVEGADGKLCVADDCGEPEDTSNVSPERCEVSVLSDGGVDISLWSFTFNMEYSCYLGTVDELRAQFEEYNQGLSTPKMRM